MLVLLTSVQDGPFADSVAAVSQVMIPECCSALIPTGCLLQQLLASLAAPWPPLLLKDLLVSVVTECTNRRIAAAVLVPCITAAAATAMAADPSSPAGPQSAAQYQLQWSSAMTHAILAELQDSGIAKSYSRIAAAGWCDSSNGTDDSNSRTNATVWDYVGAEARSQNIRALARLAVPGYYGPGPQSTSVAAAAAAAVTDNRATELRNMVVMAVQQQAARDSASEDSMPEADVETACSHNEQHTASNAIKVVATAQDTPQAAVELLPNLPCDVKFTSSSGSMPQQQQLLVGDIVHIAAQQAPAEMLSDSAYLIQGRVTAADSLGVTVSLPWTPVNLRDRLYQLSKVGNTVTFERCLRGLECMALQQISAELFADLAAAAAGGPGGPSSELSDHGSNPLQQIITTSWHLQQQHVRNSDSGQVQKGKAPSPATSASSNSSSSGSQIMAELNLLRAAGEVHVATCNAGVDGLVGSAVLNPAQRAAVEAAAVQRLTLIWGPPGTGKVRFWAVDQYALPSGAIALRLMIGASPDRTLGLL